MAAVNSSNFVSTLRNIARVLKIKLLRGKGDCLTLSGSGGPKNQPTKTSMANEDSEFAEISRAYLKMHEKKGTLSTGAGERKLCLDCGEPMEQCEHCGAWVKPCFLKMGMTHVCN